MTKRILFLLLLWLTCPRPAQAQLLLADCNLDTIETAYLAAAALNATADLECPAGTPTWAEANTLVLSADISFRLTGAGNGGLGTGACVGTCTLVTDNMVVTPIRIIAKAGRTYEISDFRFKPTALTRPGEPPVFHISGFTNNFKFHDVTFDHCGNNNARRSLEFVNNAITGVVYNNAFIAGGGTSSGRLDLKQDKWGSNSDGVTSPQHLDGNGAWMEDAQYGTARFLFFEDNLFDQCSGSTFTTPETQGGLRAVLRFNYWSDANGGAALHGTETGGSTRAPRAIENYFNKYEVLSGSCLSPGQYRGGGLMAHNNTLKCYNNIWPPLNNRSQRNFQVFKADDGSMKFDLNDATIYEQGVALTSANNKLEVSGAPWTTNQWRDGGYSVRECGPGPITETLITNCHAGTVGTGSYIWANDTNTIDFADNAVSGVGPSFQAGDVYLILRTTTVMDAPGRGRGKQLSGNPPVCDNCTINLELPWGKDWVEQVDEPSYNFNNLQCGNPGCTPTVPRVWNMALADFSNLNVDTRGPHIVQNIDVFSHIALASFDGSTGVSVGTFAQRPAACTTPGVAYWATDIGDWNSNPDGVIGSTDPLLYAGQGSLYVCARADYVDVADNATDRSVGTSSTLGWVLYYEPYTYPHPLRSVAGPELTSLLPSSGTRTLATVSVTLTGTGFNAGSFAIQIDNGCSGVAATNIAGALDTSRTSDFTISAAAVGVCGVTVSTTAGTSSLQQFTVSAPRITSIVPPAANQGETTAVTITGTTLNGATPVLTFSGTSITYNSFSCSSSTTCTANFVVAADATPGTRTVTYSTFDGSDDEIFEVFDVVIITKPVLDSITPASCYRGAKCPTLFQGTAFGGATLVKSCSDAVMTLTNETVVGTTLITADITVPADALDADCQFQVSSGGDSTFVGVDMVATTSITIPAHLTGDLIMMFAYRNDNDGPTIPAGWTVISSPISETNFFSGVYYQIATSAGTVSGTWTSANILGVLVLRDVASTAIGNVTSNSGGGTTVTYPSNTFNATDGTSVGIGFGCSRANDSTFASTAPTGMTNRDSQAGGNGSCGIHTSAADTGFDTASVSTATSGKNGAFIIEVGGSGGSNILEISPLTPAGGPNAQLRAR